jgi:cytosine/adenosine deaminase-related metal-dependent hydrolase
MDLGIAAAKAHGVAIAAAAATREALAWITTEGAKMLGAEWRIGSLAAGKQADIVLVRAGDLNMQPLHDAVSAIVFQASLANTDSVRVAGCWKKRGGALLGIDLPPLLAALNRSGRKITSALGLAH